MLSIGIAALVLGIALITMCVYVSRLRRKIRSLTHIIECLYDVGRDPVENDAIFVAATTVESNHGHIDWLGILLDVLRSRGAGK